MTWRLSDRSWLHPCLAAFLACGFWLAVASAADAAAKLRGVALVIGNSAYEHLARLPNPQNDARSVETMLDSLGFDTEISTDRDARRLARDLDRFAEDARDADVAILYYSGHGIEAGGENYLVPVDADFSALDAARERLVPVSALIAKLQASVPLTIVMLDACRDSPFPPGSLVRAAPGVQPAPIGPAGLSEARGATPLKPPSDAAAAPSVGTVIAFAAEPGHAALDGSPGGDSPYAAALTKHLSAMSGEEFGTVMRMVAQEVYLKTNGRQRPWINESLRRLLYFGKAPTEPTGDDGDILKERRQLLLTIAALPDADRKQVETTAADRGVPMDALYGMLKTLGAGTPKDPAELDKLLRDQADRLKSIMAERAALRSADPEIVRLSGLSQAAIGEGALSTAISLNERAKSRLKMLVSTLDETEANLKQRRMEAADVYARSAQAYGLNSDYLEAASDYEQAFGQVERWDDTLALQYKGGEVLSLTDHGRYKGDNDALLGAISAGKDLVGIASRLKDQGSLAKARLNLGNAYQTLGKRKGDAGQLRLAVAAYRTALEGLPREQSSQDWALAQNNLGATLSNLGELETGTATLQEAVTAFRAALEVRTRQTAPLDWAMTQTNLGNALAEFGEREAGTDHLEQAAAAFRAAGEELTRDRAPLYWAQVQTNLGITLYALGERETGTAHLEESAAVLLAALEERTRDRVPLEWAKTQMSLALAWTELGHRKRDANQLRAAVAAYRAALEEYSADRAPIDWATTQAGLGNAFRYLGQEQPNAAAAGTAMLEQALTAYRAALGTLTREHTPLDWATVEINLAVVLSDIGKRRGDADQIKEAIATFRAALEEATRERMPLLWAGAQGNLGHALAWLGERQGDTALLGQAVAAYNAALEETTRARAPLDWAAIQIDIGTASRILGTALPRTGQFDEGARQLEAAESAFQSALLEYDSQRTPNEWAAAQSNLGAVLITIGLSRGEPGRLQDAVAAFNAALTQYTREKAPLDWAATQNNLGTALRYLGQQQGDSAKLEAAIAAYRAALEVRTRLNGPLDWAQTQANLGNTLVILGDVLASAGQPNLGLGRLQDAVTTLRLALQEYIRERAPTLGAATQVDLARAETKLGLAMAGFGAVDNGVAWMQDAVAIYRQALLQYTRETAPTDWSDTQNELGSTLIKLAGTTMDPQFARDAIVAYRAALEIRTREQYPQYWAQTQTNLGLALVGLGSLTRSREAILLGKDAIKSVWDMYRAAGSSQYDNYYASALNDADNELARLN
ncbi:caspase domain-containing protein [Mesorhizobium sp. BH1-1-4]|uniref:caspase family protein n=1 Tax=Mesorhizobium sp. BH1-1-4 TaxID=2876662 RepID=UPI001CD0AA72|nr:caspase domain-containing protein [Mesorhizobium sp. BH1-1-4]MBZ9997576.1 caspase domain-containing protein [Mesorhizobium sp. BH1-1-4]